MGLLKAGAGALGGVLADQWREFFYCESLDADTLVAKGENEREKEAPTKKETTTLFRTALSFR